MLIGHIAVIMLEHHYLDVDFAPTMAGGLFPDVMDKALCHVLRLTPNGRMYAHTLLSVLISTGVVRLIAGKATARAWLLGYLGHFLADSGGFIPLLYPFRSYTFTPSPGLKEVLERFVENRHEVMFETLLLLWALLII
jgi:hypothetical protein